MRLRLIWSTLCLVLWACSAASAQNNFVSGSTGADGVFAPTQSQTITVPPSGVFNYTTMNIPSGVTITYLRNSSNTTLTILTTGDVQINGNIFADGQPGSSVGFGGFGGPGGFSGGTAGVDASNGSIADGPGAGRGGLFRAADNAVGSGGGGSYQTLGSNGGGFIIFCCGASGVGGASGPKYGTRTLVPLLGGSGGGGGAGYGASDGGGGGGGGGAILIASSGNISFNGGAIAARGGTGASVSGFNGNGGGGGSGGAIRLIANAISGAGQLLVTGGGGGGGGNGGLGYVRLEAFSLAGFNLQNGTPVSSGLPSSVAPANVPLLRITSVGGVNAPVNPIGSFQGAPDVILPANQPNPVTVVVSASNIPTGTTVNVTATSGSGASTTGTATLSGTTASSTGSASVSLTTGFSVLTATTVVDLAQTGELKPLFINGEQVDKIEVAAQFGGGSAVTYITHSGHRIQAVR